MLALGLATRVVLAFKSYGVTYDIQSFEAVRYALEDAPLDVYSIVNGHPNNRWPYPPGFFPWVLAAAELSNVRGVFHGWIQMPQIAADAAIAWFVQDHLGRRGAGERLRLTAAGLVALGPSFLIISGYHGQIDSLAILPAVVALWFWERSQPGTRRAVVTGLLIGVGASFKTVPGLMLFALLPAVRAPREAVALVAPAVALPLLALAPWLAADFAHTVESLRSHRALPGFGGIGLIAQPELAAVWLHDDSKALTGLSQFLSDQQQLLVLPALAPFIALAFARRLDPTVAAALLWSALVVFNVGFAFQYVVWVLPFLLMAGYVWQVAAVQGALFVPAAMLYWDPFGFSPTGLYVAIMIAVWCAAAAALVVHAVRLARRVRPPVPRGRAAASPS
jgi:hypothetical protein